jgi:D-alanyl-D-alanine carboxypeptidase
MVAVLLPSAMVAVLLPSAMVAVQLLPSAMVAVLLPSATVAVQLPRLVAGAEAQALPADPSKRPATCVKIGFAGPDSQSGCLP